MSETVRFQEVLRRLAMVDETFVTLQAGLGLGPAGTAALDGRTAALLIPISLPKCYSVAQKSARIGPIEICLSGELPLLTPIKPRWRCS